MKRGRKRQTEGGFVEEVGFLWFLTNNVMHNRLCRFVCAAEKPGLKTPTSLYPSAAEGLRGGAGRRQLRDQGLLIFGGSRGPRLRGPRWGRWVGVPTMLSGLPSTVYKGRLVGRKEDASVWKLTGEGNACLLMITFHTLSSFEQVSLLLLFSLNIVYVVNVYVSPPLRWFLRGCLLW